MLRILSSAKRLCNGLCRRDFLQAGGLGLIGPVLPHVLSQTSAAGPSSIDRPPGFGNAKRCILLFLYGSPSQLETFDMKPKAPVEIRGTMNPIASSLPGLDVCEGLPELSKVMDRTTVVRSVTHPYPIAAATAVTDHHFILRTKFHAVQGNLVCGQGVSFGARYRCERRAAFASV